MRKKKKIRKKSGICKLTFDKGVFIKSHLIPESLTKPSIEGNPLVQFGNNNRPPIRRWTSWYDHELVTQKGEDILTEFDTWAIKTLRKKNLVWSGWGKESKLESLTNLIGTELFSLRKIENFNSKKLRLFFLSLLWRASASTLDEFSEINLPDIELEKLRKMLIHRNHEPLYFYPITLIQLSTKGDIHNLSPFVDIKKIPSILGSKEKEIPIYRFYFDGLIAHIHIQSRDDRTISDLGSLVVGYKKELLVTTQTYEKSFERENLSRVVSYDMQKHKLNHPWC